MIRDDGSGWCSHAPLLAMPSLFHAQIWDAHVLCFMLPDLVGLFEGEVAGLPDRKSTRLNSSHPV